MINEDKYVKAIIILNKSHYLKVKIEAKKLKVSASEVIRRAIGQYLSKNAGFSEQQYIPQAQSEEAKKEETISQIEAKSKIEGYKPELDTYVAVDPKPVSLCKHGKVSGVNWCLGCMGVAR